MSIKTNGVTVISDERKATFDVVNPGVFTTIKRNALTPDVGDIVYNSDDAEMQVWDGIEWTSAGSGGQKGSDGGILSSGNGTIIEPITTSPYPDGTNVARYLHVEYAPYQADPSDPFEAYEVLFSYDEDFSTVLWHWREEEEDQLGMYSTILADGLTTVYMRLTYISTSGNRAEKTFAYETSETFEGEFFFYYPAGTFDGYSMTVTIDQAYVAGAKVYALNGAGSGGGNGQAASRSGWYREPGAGGSGACSVILGRPWTDYTSSNTYTFSNNNNQYPSSQAFKLSAGSQQDLSYSSGDSQGLGFTTAAEVVDEWNARIRPYHISTVGARGNKGSDGDTRNGYQGRGGYGGAGGVEMIKTGEGANEVVGEYLEAPTWVGNTGGTGGCSYRDQCHHDNYATGGYGGRGGSGIGHGGGGGGSAGDTSWGDWPHLGGGSSGSSAKGRATFIVVKATLASAFRNTSVPTEADLANLDRSTLLPRESIEIVDTGETAIYSPGRDEFIIYNVPNNVTLARNI